MMRKIGFVFIVLLVMMLLCRPAVSGIKWFADTEENEAMSSVMKKLSNVAVSGSIKPFRYENDNIASLFPTIYEFRVKFGMDTGIGLVFFNKKGQLAKIVISVTEISSIIPLGLFNQFRNQMKKKYGKPTIEVERYAKPYEEGDGHTRTAIKVGCYMGVVAWKKTDVAGVVLFMNKDGLVLAYESEEFGEATRGSDASSAL